MSAASPGAKRVAKSKAALRARGGATPTVDLAPEAVTDAAFLVASGWAPNRTAVINRAVQALAAAERLVQGVATP